MSEREFLTRKLLSAHERMDSVYASLESQALSFGLGAYSSAESRLRNAERAAWNAGYAPYSLVRWNSELQAWRVVS